MDIVLAGAEFTTPGVQFPRTTFSDDFNRADSSDLGVTSVDERAWVVNLGAGVTAATFGVASNTGRIKTITGTGRAIALVDTGWIDHQVAFTLANTPTANARWYIAASDADNALELRANPGQLTLTRVVGGTATNIVTNFAAVANGDTIRARATGTEVFVYVNGTLAWSGAASLPGNPTKAGFGALSSASVGAIDNFTVTYP